jgi:hypothetical protein
VVNDLCVEKEAARSARSTKEKSQLKPAQKKRRAKSDHDVFAGGWRPLRDSDRQHDEDGADGWSCGEVCGRVAAVVVHAWEEGSAGGQQLRARVCGAFI